jgi:NrS-1  polymerase HBD domain
MSSIPDDSVEEKSPDTRPPKPTALPVHPESIPLAVQELSQWVFWRYTWIEKKQIWDKPPLQSHSGNLADSSKPKTWSGFEAALNAYHFEGSHADGIGFMFDKDHQHVGGDLDDCRDPETGVIEPWAQAIIDQVNTYTEISTSGTGVHFIAQGQLPGRGLNVRYTVDGQQRHVELYDSSRYFATTGHHLPGTPKTIEPRQEAATHLYHYLREQQAGSKRKAEASQQHNGASPHLDDDVILQKALSARNGRKLAALWAGEINGYPSQSEADLALCRDLAFWTQDPEQIDRLFRRSGLMRGKWDEHPQYAEWTISKAIETTPEHYQGVSAASSNGQPHVADEEEPPYHTAEINDDQKESTSSKPGITFGGVLETTNGYYRIRTIKEQLVKTQISSFVVQPTLRIWVDGSEAVRANIKKGDKALAEVTIERHCWHSRGAFLKVLTSLDQWCIATDNEIQAIQAMVAMQRVPSKRGTRTLGLVDGVWVSDEGIFDKSGWIQDPELVYLPVSGESPLTGRLRYRVPHPSERVAVAQAVYQRVWKLNELMVIGALIGWFFSTPFKPYIHIQVNHFPILNVWGTMGAGKTSLLRLFWKLFGVDSELLACTDTEFSLLTLLSATGSIPLVFDEFKPYDMKPDQVRRFERILRRVYDGDTEHRGRPDLRLIAYRLMAPVAVAGEVSVARQPAMRERIIPVSPSKTWLPEHEDARKAYSELVKLPLHAFASLFIEWSMGQDFSSQWASADRALTESIDREMPERIRDDLRVVSFGLRQFERFGQDYGLSIPEQLDMGAIFNGILDQLVSADGRSRVGLDVLLEHLAAMAEMGRLVEGRHYLAKKTDGYLALRLDSCLAEYRRYAKDTASDDEVLSKESYLRQLRENHESKGYVVEVSGRAYFGNDQLRVVRIDRDKAEASGIDLGGFTRAHE